MNEPALSGETSGLVIGRGADLSKSGALATGEYRLGWMSVQNSLGMEAEANVNLYKLGQIMEQGLPIRDASIGNIGGFYTNLERGMLYQSDWNLFGDYWVPPWY
jgi:hypothetical protein